MSCRERISLEEADAEVDSARTALVTALEAPWDDETATERISAAARRLRAARAGQAAARVGVSHLPDLVGSG